MFASKHGEHSGALNDAADCAFSVMLEPIESGQAEGRANRRTGLLPR